MASRTHQPDQVPQRGAKTKRGSRTFRVDRYELGLDVPLTERFVRVDITRDGEGVRVAVDDDQRQWIVRVVDGDIEEQWRRDRTGGREVLGRVPRWVLVVLDHVGVIA